MKWFATRTQALAVFAIVFAAYVASPVKTCFDSHWSIPTVLSVLREHNFDLDEYRPTPISHGVLTVNGHLITEYPVGGPLVALPFVFVFDGGVRLARPWLASDSKLARAADRWLRHADATGLIDLQFFDTVELLVASLVVATTAAVMFLLAKTRLGLAQSLVIAFCFAFATSAWSTASRALWQHGPLMLCVSVGLWCLVNSRERPALAGLAGLPFALGYVCRPTASLPLLAFGMWVLVKHRSQAVRFGFFALVVLVPFFFLNRSIYGTWLTSYYLPGGAGDEYDFWQALAGHLVSPSRGLLVYSSVFLFSGWGALLAWRSKMLDGLEVAAVAVIVTQWVLLSRFWCWWGGHSYGPRLLCDVVPYFMLLLVPVVARLFEPAASWVLRGAFAGLLLLSCAIHFRGATTWSVYEWNSKPVSVNDDVARVWQWGDAQFLRGLFR